MEYAEVEFLGVRKMSYTGHEHLFERPIIGPFRKDAVDGGVMDGKLAMRVLGYGHALPLHPGLEDPPNEIQETMITQFALGTTLGHREVREDPCGELRGGALDRHGRRCRRLGRGVPHARASYEEV
jgi:hypothetical protein